jgi:hypothetical protein
MSNGIYDFILAYFNPTAENTFDNADLSARLPAWPAAGLTLDGAHNGGITARNIGGIQAAAADRKAAAPGVYGSIGGGYNGQPYQKSEPRVDYTGNITVPMANYLACGAGITEFANTNIIGASDMWNYGSGAKNLYTIRSRNIGIVGDYSAENNFQANVEGILDIKGKAPTDINNFSGKLNRINLWDNITYPVLLSVPIVFVGGTGGENVRTGVAGYPTTFAKVIIYAKKYTGTPNATLKPYHRAFLDTSGQVKLTGPDLTGIDPKYLGSNPNQPVPSLNEEDWIKFANGATGGFSPGVSIVNGTLQLAPSYAALDSQYKWASAADFNANAVE